MNHPFEFEHAAGQFFDAPITYNPMIAKALQSTKAAILLDYLVEQETTGDLILSHKGISADTGLGLTEVKTALSILENNRVIDKSKTCMNLINCSINPFFMNDLIGNLEKHKHIDGHLAFDLISPIAVNRLHMKTLKSLGVNANASILISFFMAHLSEKDRLEQPDFTDWFESRDALWVDMVGMTEKEMRVAKKSLLDIGLIERKRIGMPSKLHLQLNVKKLAEITWVYAVQQPVQSPVVESIMRAIA